MPRDTRSIRLRIQHKLAVTHGAVTFITVLVVGGTLRALAGSESVSGGWIALLAFVAAVGATLLGALLTQSTARRLNRVLEMSRAWLRGNLSLRLRDRGRDELGLLAENLDLLIEHLEEDEEDLQSLRERNARLTDQVRALAVVEERNRLARELHDSVKQHLFSLAMTASAIRTRFEALGDLPGDLREMITEVERSAQTAQQETTRLIKDLRPDSLQEQGLAAALNDYTLIFGAREHLLIYLEVQGNDDLLPPSVAEALYRVAQEALHNVARHSRATRVDVHLRCIPEQVALTIEDNGVGFDTEQADRGLGLTNMQERMLKIGGRLKVESERGTGTQIIAEVGLGQAFAVQSDLAGPERYYPRPTINNWNWLGQKLVIPVGQIWPWLPADQTHLRRPLIEPGDEEIRLKRTATLLGLRRDYILLVGPRRLVHVHQTHAGYEWEENKATWTMRQMGTLSGRAVLTRNGQPLAAMQYQGRQVHTWSEIIYDGRGYRLSYVQEQEKIPCDFTLVGQTGELLLCVRGTKEPTLDLQRALPLPLLIMATTRIVDELAAVNTK
ncbi:MAG: HAMP domain-containing sensor histidine kinase [Anaerolineae bacterium]